MRLNQLNLIWRRERGPKDSPVTSTFLTFTYKILLPGFARPSTFTPFDSNTSPPIHPTPRQFLALDRHVNNRESRRGAQGRKDLRRPSLDTTWRSNRHHIHPCLRSPLPGRHPPSRPRSQSIPLSARNHIHPSGARGSPSPFHQLRTSSRRVAFEVRRSSRSNGHDSLCILRCRRWGFSPSRFPEVV